MMISVTMPSRVVLIEPCGIETIDIEDRPGGGYTVLIEPCGIETE